MSSSDSSFADVGDEQMKTKIKAESKTLNKTVDMPDIVNL